MSDKIRELLVEVEGLRSLSEGGHDDGTDRYSTIAVRNHERLAQLERVILALGHLRTPAPETTQNAINGIIRNFDEYGAKIRDQYLKDYGMEIDPNYKPPLRDGHGNTLSMAPGNPADLQREFDVRSGRLRDEVITALRSSGVSLSRDPETWLL